MKLSELSEYLLELEYQGKGNCECYSYDTRSGTSDELSSARLIVTSKDRCDEGALEEVEPGKEVIVFYV